MRYLIYMTSMIVTCLYTTDLRADEIEYNAVCIEDQNIGFLWKNSRWVSSKFKTKKYIISKVNVGANDDTTRCDLKKKSKGYTIRNSKSADGCYNIRELGKDYYSSGSTWCVEEYKKSISSSEKFQLVSVTCNPNIYETFVFNPSGSFHRSYIHRFLSTDRGFNDTMHLSVGSCSKI